MNTIFDELRFNIRHYRELKGWTQAQLAIQADSSNGMIGNIESGHSKPSFDNIVKIASALGVHPADLFLRDASIDMDKKLFTKYSQFLSSFDSIPMEFRSAIELMVANLSKKHLIKK